MAIGGAFWKLLPERAVRELESGGVSSWSKGFVVFAIPLIFLVFHFYNCVIKKHKTRKDDQNQEALTQSQEIMSKASPNPISPKVMYWTLPVLCAICFIVFVILTFVWRV